MQVTSPDSEGSNPSDQSPFTFMRLLCPTSQGGHPKGCVQNGNNQASGEGHKIEHHFWAAAVCNWFLRYYTRNSARQSVGPLPKATKKYEEGLPFDPQDFS
jgi:hypothetical protein